MRIEKNTPADTEPAGDVLFCSFMQFFRIFFFEVFFEVFFKGFFEVFFFFVCFAFIRMFWIYPF